MTCLDVRGELAVSLLSGTPLSEELTEHLAGCDECRHELEQLRGVVDLMVYAPPQGVERPEANDLRLRRLVAAAEKERSRQRRRSYWTLAAAILILLVLPAAALSVRLGVFSSGAQQVVAPRSPVESSATNQQNGVSARVSLSPSVTGSDVVLSVSGVAPQTRCSLVAVEHNGASRVLLVWQAGYRGTAQVRTSADVPVAQIAHLDLLDTTTGHLLVRIPVVPA